ncbi:hypothetical protein [Brevundimonas sp.]|uniref:hypothetical protein n=1 Tax=Brevundimonas sp. TaxID=1871086 RepID=UPI0035B2DEA9
MTQSFATDTERVTFEEVTQVLHLLRADLRRKTPNAFLDHPAYAAGNFPIHWQGQNEFLKAARPPAYVRFSHHPTDVDRGFSIVGCFSRDSASYAEALSDVVMEAYRSRALRRGVSVTRLDAKMSWSTRGVHYAPVYIHWEIKV